MKLYKKQQAEIAHTKQFIASCGTFSNLVRQAKSRQKQVGPTTPLSLQLGWVRWGGGGEINANAPC